MALETCQDCGHEVSTSATSCPSCGRPRKRRCVHCGMPAVENIDGVRGMETLLLIALTLLMFIPGLLYYFDRTRLPYCTACHRRNPKA